MALAVATLSGCGALRDFHGANSLPLPGTKGGGPGSYTVQAQMPDVQNLEGNSRVRVDDLTVGTVTKIDVRDGTRWSPWDRRRRPPAGQRDCHARSNQPAGLVACRTGRTQ